jgi:hypothetical protein
MKSLAFKNETMTGSETQSKRQNTGIYIGKSTLFPPDNNIVITNGIE